MQFETSVNLFYCLVANQLIYLFQGARSVGTTVIEEYMKWRGKFAIQNHSNGASTGRAMVSWTA